MKTVKKLKKKVDKNTNLRNIKIQIFFLPHLKEIFPLLISHSLPVIQAFLKKKI